MNKLPFQKTIAIDFDNTITSGNAESHCIIPPPRKNAIKVINSWVDDGYIVIINTLRNGQDWEVSARKYLREYGIRYTLFNENPRERVEKYGESRKISCDISIDDRSLLGIPDDFDEIDRIVREKIGNPIYQPIKPSTANQDKPQWSPLFLEKAKHCAMRTYICDALESPSVTFTQIIEGLTNQIDVLNREKQINGIMYDDIFNNGSRCM